MDDAGDGGDNGDLTAAATCAGGSSNGGGASSTSGGGRHFGLHIASICCRSAARLRSTRRLSSARGWMEAKAKRCHVSGTRAVSAAVFMEVLDARSLGQPLLPAASDARTFDLVFHRLQIALVGWRQWEPRHAVPRACRRC